MGLIDGTKRLGQSLSGILRQLGSMFLQFGMGKLFSFLPFAKGGVFAQNNVVPFAYGGVVNKPTLFPMARGMGLMGEAGPEAIMPLRRGRGGRLGVEAAGGGMTTVNVSVDASSSSVQGDSAQASQLGKAIGVAVQTEILKQKRPGGLLATV
jgi:phage-related minor tail protein